MVRAKNQLKSYLQLIPEASNGILFFIPFEKDPRMAFENEEIEVALGVKAHIAVIYPRPK
jgi:hypothetical protein